MVGAIYARWVCLSGEDEAAACLLIREVENEVYHHFWADVGPTGPLFTLILRGWKGDISFKAVTRGMAEQDHLARGA